MLFHIGRTAAGTRWGLGVGWVSYFSFHHQSIWIDTKVVKKTGCLQKVCYGYFDNPYINHLFVFSVFGFRKQIEIDFQIRIFKK